MALKIQLRRDIAANWTANNPLLLNGEIGIETDTLKTTHIDFRTGYIEGAGQLCRECYMKGSSEGREHISIPKHFVKTYSNNAELGERVRRYYYDNY